jgi:hypothetical protein
LFVFRLRSIAAEPRADSKNTAGFQGSRAALEEARLVMKVLAALHDPDQAETGGSGRH